MNITLKKMTLRNFKGIKSLSIDFSDVTNIYGDNAEGKTTIFDAFLWMLFGKDSSDRKDFNIKTLDSSNNAISKLEHEVSALLIVDEREVSIKRLFREKWTKKRGEEIAEFTGHETEFYYNDVPKSQAEFKQKIDDILKEDVFKLITSAAYYNGLKWQDRRNILMDLAGNLSNDDVLSNLKNGKNFANLMFVLNSGKSLVEYKKEIGAKKKIIKDEMLQIPGRIDELKRMKPDPIDTVAIESQINEWNEKIGAIETEMSDKMSAHQKAFEAIRNKQEQINGLKTRKGEIIFNIRTELQNAGNDDRQKENAFTNKIKTVEINLQAKSSLLASTQANRESYEKQLETLRNKYRAINAEELNIDPHDFACPTCKREFDAEDISTKKAELQQNFMDDKNRRLNENRAAGLKLSDSLKAATATIDTLTTEIETLNNELTAHREEFRKWAASIGHKEQPEDLLHKRLADHDEYISIQSQIAVIEGQIQNRPVLDDTDLKNKRAALNLELDALKRQLANQDKIEQINTRIDQLEAEEKTMSQELARLEKDEFLINEFDKTKMNMIESRINGKFKFVKFKMFERQINGGEDPCCETLINGVPYSDANNASRINAGVDIINALCNHYQVWAPIFIDNRESVTQLIHSDSQIINLIVMKGAKLSVNEIVYRDQLEVA